MALIIAVALFACGSRANPGRETPWRALARRIEATSTPDSTAVVVLFDQDAIDSLTARLPRSFALVPLRMPVDAAPGAIARESLGKLYRDASAATTLYPDVWVVERRSGSPERTRAAWFPNAAARLLRQQVLRDSLHSEQGTIEFSRWVDRAGGAAQRAEMNRARAAAESLIARGVPKPVPITRPFTYDELRVDADTLAYYLGELADTSLYSIGGCSDVELINWTAPAKLAELGPGVVPALMARVDDPDPFVSERAQEALSYVTQDERILARTGGEYIKFYDQPGVPAHDVVRAWWGKYARFWTPAASSR